MAYKSTNALEIVEQWEQRHQNGDRTLVAVLSCGDGYTAIAYDFGPYGEFLESEEIESTQTKAEAEAQAEVWQEEHPKGVNPGGGGLLGKLKGDS